VALVGLALFAGFSIGLVAYLLMTGMAAVQADAEDEEELLFSENPIFQAIAPFVQAIGKVVSTIGILGGMRRDIRHKLTRAGKADTISPDEFIGFMIFCAGIGVLIGLYFSFMIGLGPQLVIGITFMTGVLPFLSLRDTIAKRQKAIRKILPYTLDLLCLAVEAGLDFTAALNRIAEKLPNNPFRDEIRLLSRDISMGKTRSEALKDMEHRIGLEELTSVISALIQADELGSSLGPTLRIQSSELQRKRFQRAERKAMQAPVLMLIPLVIFIFPLVFMVIFAPIVLRVMEMGVL
jgi:tight adherence protein C